MKIDTDDLSEITIYGISLEDMIDLADLPDGIETWYSRHPYEYFYLNDRDGGEEQLYIAKDFVEKTISLIDPEIEMNQDDRFESNYYSYTCYLNEKKMEVVTDSDTRPIPQSIADKLVIFSLFYDLKFDIKKADVCEQKEVHANASCDSPMC